MTDFLLELRSEEIPARMQKAARQELEKLFRQQIDAAGLTAETLDVYSTPRRLALIAKGLADETQAVSEERKGPRADAPDKAIEGFLRSTGLSRDQLVAREDKKGNAVLFAVIETPGRATRDVLAEAIPAIVRAFSWPKSMRWGAASTSTESLKWVRPLQGIVAILGEDLVPCAIANIDSGFDTVGHRFHHDGPITIGGADDYIEKLRACHVIVDQAEREAIVRDGAAQAASAAGLELVADEGLVVENAGLTEWPVPLLGRFDAAFLDVPPEVIQLTARVNQKYFVCQDAHGTLANAFVCTANIDAHDGGKAVVAGNEKVLSARLSDAKFFWDLDRKTKLETHAEKLKAIVFHEKLGTLADKVDRVAKLARWLVEEGIVTSSPERGGGPPRSGGGGVSADRTDSAGTHPPSVSSSTSHLPTGGEDLERAALADLAEQAARLCKADLVTEMVGEFPELQGLMGGYYAAAEGLDQRVADAIRDHYKPVGQGDDVPTAPVTVAVSLADKLDTLVGFFGRTLKPTGSKDPFALRRAMISVLQLLQSNGLRCGFHKLFWQASGKYQAYYSAAENELFEFAVDRLKVQQREAGVRHDLIDAVFALGGEDDLVRLLARVHALQAFVETDEGRDLLAGYKRAANILKKEDVASDAAPDAISLSYTPENAEKALIDSLDSAETRAASAVEAEDFEGAMAALASLRDPIDRFFEEVTVNDENEDKRAARLALLARFRAAVHQVADFSRIDG
ncbi:glycine--tRNA ligase subunit beta [Novosphingopyxis baekryungensis]|uniref:glycine--tRNA ligase subunit beta n=1 Tax=Novosphingopyxis baekryungensis TaxID=279369 RepID=UPI0003B5BD02|nr:glycine--tRNA ligase subunit beta [Novosphingopyxis baekryungensis]